jgi:hypothetical protein
VALLLAIAVAEKCIKGMSTPFKEHKQKELRELIMEVLWRNPKLNYYQVRSTSRMT